MSVFNRLPSLIQCVSQLHKPVKIWNLAKWSRSSQMRACLYLQSPATSSMFHAHCVYGMVPVQGFVSVRNYSSLEERAKALTKREKPIIGQKGYKVEKVVNFDHSGDLLKLQNPVNEETLFGYDELDFIKDEPEELQRLFTLEFADGNQRMAHELNKLEEKFSDVCGPFNSLEKIIAKDTVHIRHLINHCTKFKKDKKAKVILEERIAKRRKRLKNLRKLDYERFIWLLKTLHIQYVPVPAYPTKMTRAAKVKKEAWEKATAYRKHKMEELKARIEKEYEIFKVQKEKELAEIEKVIQEFGLDKEKILKDIEKERAQKK